MTRISQYLVWIIVIAVCGNHLAYGAVNKKDDYTPLKYPGPVKEMLHSRYGDVPEECANKNYCTIKPADYPQERFNKLFKGTKPVSQPTLVIDELSGAPNRQGDTDPDYLDNCESVVTYEPLYKVRNSRGWHTVVQAPEENYVQKVRLETCSQEEGPCFTAFPALPEFKTYCKQKYSVWEFLVFSDDTNSTERVSSELPICCSCHYKTVI